MGHQRDFFHTNIVVGLKNTSIPAMPALYDYLLLAALLVAILSPSFWLARRLGRDTRTSRSRLLAPRPGQPWNFHFHAPEAPIRRRVGALRSVSRRT